MQKLNQVLDDFGPAQGLGSSTGGGGPESGLTSGGGADSGLTQNGGPVGDLTQGGGPVGGLTNGLTSANGPLGSLGGIGDTVGGLIGGLGGLPGSGEGLSVLGLVGIGSDEKNLLDLNPAEKKEVRAKKMKLAKDREAARQLA